MFCDGSTLPIAKYSALFSLLGTMYGGDGMTTFSLPDLNSGKTRNEGPLYIICVYGIFPPRD